MGSTPTVSTLVFSCILCVVGCLLRRGPTDIVVSVCSLCILPTMLCRRAGSRLRAGSLAMKLSASTVLAPLPARCAHRYRLVFPGLSRASRPPHSASSHLASPAELEPGPGTRPAQSGPPSVLRAGEPCCRRGAVASERLLTTGRCAVAVPTRTADRSGGHSVELRFAGPSAMLSLRLAVHPALLYPLDIQLSYCWTPSPDTASHCWPPALLSRSPRFQASPVLLPLTLSLTRPRLSGAAVAHWTPACRHCTGPLSQTYPLRHD